MRAFLGLLLGMGVVRKPTISSYWNEGDKNWLASTPSFGATMSRNRFQIIMRFLHCNDNSTAVPRGQPGHDPLHKIRPVLDLVNGSFANTHRLAQSVCVNERMVGFKGRHHLVQYMANKKAHRWGVKLWILAEAGTGYTHQVRIYKGRNLGGPPPRAGLGHSVVMDLMEQHLDKGHHIICDNFFSSPSLCHDLFDRKTFCTGVVAVRRKGMPSSFVGKRPPRGSTIVRRQGPLLAVLFSDRRVFTILSTMGSPRMEDGLNSRGRSVTLPSVVRLYNTLMGGVDLGDQLIAVYDPQVRSVKLWKKILINFLLTASVNAYQTFMNTHGRTTPRLDFHMSLTKGYNARFSEKCYREATPKKKPDLDTEHLKNYRPVSNLPFLSKLIERAVAERLSQHLTLHNLYDPLQSAYRPRHSTETALLKVVNDLRCAIDSGNVALLVLLDLSAAFDTIDHQRLLQRLQDDFGVQGSALNWFSSYLSQRSQCVYIDGQFSDSVHLNCGVPQGSVLGPILFTLYTKELGQVIDQHKLPRHLYADDTQLIKIFRPIASIAEAASADVTNCCTQIKNG
ncbi:piggyBac transposable element-derived protein 3-like [Haliotis rubra]|uniref:piggyBac transposable element-derived protein 3-like n=1 Tax=Haliotis rubra TaxID=36100 RepID=UPI001EE5D46D|nr:piggyBac transposable element-derived protein 3-like [Haliotis rubra]